MYNNIKKITFYLIGLIILSISAYYGSFFLRNSVVSDSRPELMDKVGNDEFGSLIVTKKQGSFQGSDFVHRSGGQAILLESGIEKILRFENFSVTNGPDLYVYLVKTDRPTNDQQSLGEYIDLGKLKGNRGDQNYNISQVIDGYGTVVIWCKQYSQVFAFAKFK